MTVRKTLKQLNTRPKKGLSQNFLTDQNLIKKFVEAASLSPSQNVIEIGPGTGAITKVILEKTSHCLLIEKDRTLYEHLKEQYKNDSNVQVIHEDILKWDFSLDAQNAPYKVLSNIPFQLTSPLLGQLLPKYPLIESCYLIIQKELATRILAKPKTKDFSHLTLFTRFYSEPKLIFDVPKSSFYPPPKVDASALEFKLKPPPKLQASAFFKWTKQAFSQKRKMLRSTLPFNKVAIENALEELKLSSKARPEELDLSNWIALLNLLCPEELMLENEE